MILAIITHQKYPGWASLASVCKEWQQVSEKANFYKIKLGVACLHVFQYFIPLRKREMIHHICLNV